MPRNTDYLFVYGTLRPAARHPMLRWLRRYACWVGPGSCRGRLYDLGSYPGLIPDAHGDLVQGDVFRLLQPRPLLRVLDRYEGCASRMPGPREYRRDLIEVFCKGQTLRAWSYVYLRPTARGQRIASGDYLGRQASDRAAADDRP